MIGIGTIFRRRTGSGGPLPPDYAKWVKEHMVFWYDMSKPVDVYIPGVTYANQFIGDGGKLKYDTTINKCTITHTPTTTNRNFWQITCASSSTIDSYKIRVTGLPKGFTIQSSFYSNKITSDGEYDIASYTNTATSTRYVGFYLAGDNVSDVDCNIVVEEIPTRQSVPTNEILKANPYLQDFSGNNRPLKLNNFLFAAMSGVGGYQNEAFINKTGAINIKFNQITDRQIKGKPTQDNRGFGYYRVENMIEGIVYCNWHVEGILDDNKVYFAQYTVYDNRVELHNGDNYIELDTNQGKVGYNFISVISDQPYSTDITITQIPEYPGALVTDGVDDYGQVQNLQQGVKMLFYTCNNFRLSQILYDQRKLGYDNIQSSYFSIFARANTIAYNARNVDGITYIDGELNESTIVDNFLKKKTIITIVNNSADSEKTGRPSFFSTYNNLGYFANLAFYNSIGFDSIPTKETDGFTEQELIDYVLKNLITQ